jgi:hypothetical protein
MGCAEVATGASPAVKYAQTAKGKRRRPTTTPTKNFKVASRRRIAARIEDQAKTRLRTQF